MISEDFEEVFEDRVNKCRNALIRKNIEYARGSDMFSNFRKAAARQSCTVERALLGMETKHSISIADLIVDLDNGIEHPMPIWEEKIGDELNYLFLLRGLLAERYSHLDGRAIAGEKPKVPCMRRTTNTCDDVLDV